MHIHLYCMADVLSNSGPSQGENIPERGPCWFDSNKQILFFSRITPGKWGTGPCSVTFLRSLSRVESELSLRSSLRLGHKFITAGSQQHLHQTGRFPVNPRVLAHQVKASAFERGGHREVSNANSYCFTLSTHVQEIHIQVNLAKRKTTLWKNIVTR